MSATTITAEQSSPADRLLAALVLPLETRLWTSTAPPSMPAAPQRLSAELYLLDDYIEGLRALAALDLKVEEFSGGVVAEAHLAVGWAHGRLCDLIDALAVDAHGPAYNSWAEFAVQPAITWPKRLLPLLDELRD